MKQNSKIVSFTIYWQAIVYGGERAFAVNLIKALFSK